jgi:hypothetical protein
MKRTTVFLYETTECDLKALARQQGRPVADMVREALVDYVAREKEKARRPLRFVAIGDSGVTDTAERHEELVFAGLDPHTGIAASPRPDPPRPVKHRRRKRAAPARRTRA